MIVKMSKIRILGPKEVLEKILSFFQELGILQIEEIPKPIAEPIDKELQSFIPDEKTISERLFLEELNKRIDEFFSYLPPLSVRKSYIEPSTIIDTISESIKRHINICKDLSQKRQELKRELEELSKYKVFVEVIEGIIKDIGLTPGLDFIGIKIKEKKDMEDIKRILSKSFKDRFEIFTEKASDGSIVGLIVTEKKLTKEIKDIFKERDITEFSIPLLEDQPFYERISYIKDKTIELSKNIKEIDEKIFGLAVRWGPIYRRVKEWIDERLSMIKALSCLYETRMCFILYGWVPSEKIPELKDRLAERFKGTVVVEESEILEEDLDRVPVIIKNPAYFKPFELFTRLLPLPHYKSFDPTPFIGIFFPLFFGMILGDAGYGLLLLFSAIFLIKKFKERRNIYDAARILLVSSGYTIFFGILYGEFFGEIPRLLFGIEPLCVERRTAILPVLIFAVSVGFVHIIIGISLGIISAMKKRKKNEVIYRFLNILIILCIAGLITSLFGIAPSLFTKPVIIVILILTPLLFFTGGILAPFELIKSIGNIISYVRIMAIGLTSVLLSFVANTFAGITGDIIIGIFVAAFLHLINIILGIFSPTIHSLRLHYVEFFSKFIETGGRRFEPLKKIK